MGTGISERPDRVESVLGTVLAVVLLVAAVLAVAGVTPGQG